MLAILLLPTAILLSLRLLYYLFGPLQVDEPVSEEVERLQYRLRSAAAIVLAIGVVASAWVYRQADPNAIDTTDVVSYDMVNGLAVPIHAADSKKYSRDLERFGGKLGVLFTEVGNDVTEAFHGRNLAYLVFAFSLVGGIGCLASARALTFYRDDSSGGQDTPAAPDPQPAPPGRTVRWTLKLIRRSRLVRTR